MEHNASKVSDKSGQNNTSSQRKSAGTKFSMASQVAKRGVSRGSTREETIVKNIQKVFDDRERKMSSAIIATIHDDKLRIYLKFRKDYEDQIKELERDRLKLYKRKKNKKNKETKALLIKNTTAKVLIICTVLKKTYLHYKKSYFESDNYRQIRLLEIQLGEEAAALGGASGGPGGDRDQKLKEMMHSRMNKGIVGVSEENATYDQKVQMNLNKGLSFVLSIVPQDKDAEVKQAEAEWNEKLKLEEQKKSLQSNIENEVSAPEEEPVDQGDMDYENFMALQAEKNKQQNSVSSHSLNSPVTSKFYSSKKFIDQLRKFFQSPFKDDNRFAVHYMAQLTRDKIHESEKAINALFPFIFEMLMESKDRTNKHKAFEVLCNMVQSDTQRKKLATEGFFKQVFNKMQPVADAGEDADMGLLEKLSWLITLISYHQDMFELIISLDLLQFILKLSEAKYPNKIRSNAVLAISLLTYNEKLFDEIIKQGVIDLIMELCRDQDQELQVRQYSTLALVHFALSKKSIKILISKGVLDLFDTFGSDDSGEVNVIIQTNVSWIFLALCNNGITGNEMLKKGITRDMFLVSCNPDYQQIRHLVITGFAELGKSTNKQKQIEQLSQDKQRIKEAANIGKHKHLTDRPQANIDILLQFTASDDDMFQYTAFWALKDYILLTHDALVPDISEIIQAFLQGCLSTVPQEDEQKRYIQQQQQQECINAISFLVTHKLVYYPLSSPGFEPSEVERGLQEIRDAPINNILDAIMLISGNESIDIRTTAFSTLSSLSKYSSQHKSVMAQIQRDIDLPPHLSSKNYHDFMKGRLQEKKDLFYSKFKNDAIQETYSGLYSLLRLGQQPTDYEINDAANKYIEFISIRYDPDDECHLQNEQYFLKVFEALRHTKNPDILKKLLKVIKFYIDQDDSPCQKEIIKPDTILWMLEIMEEQRSYKYLCCLTSATLLSIVNKHEIHFDYQEVAIIKKFNNALQNIVTEDEGCNIIQQTCSSNNKIIAVADLAKTPTINDLQKLSEESQTRIVDINKIDEQSKEAISGPEASPVDQSLNEGFNVKEVENTKSNFTSPQISQHEIEVPNANASGKGSGPTGDKEENLNGKARNEQSMKSQKSSKKSGDRSQSKSKKLSQNKRYDEDTDKMDSMNQRLSFEHDANQLQEQSADQVGLDIRQQLNIQDGEFDEASPISIKQRSINENEIEKPARDLQMAEVNASYKTEQNKVDQNSITFQAASNNPTSQSKDDAVGKSVNSRRTPNSLQRVSIPEKDFQRVVSQEGSTTSGKQDKQEPEVQESPTYIELKKQQRLQMHLQQLQQSRALQEANDGKSGKLQTGAQEKFLIHEGSSTFMASQGTGRKINIFNTSKVNKIVRKKTKEGLSGTDSDEFETIPVEEINPHDHELVEIHLRDSLIKSFMVIFTNEQSQHLLLNKDLIDIAFNCLESCHECTLEAKKHVARLISIIFKFPQVQEKLMDELVITGICDLLNQKKHMGIIRYTIKACTYISMNYEFIKKSQYSMKILQSMMKLLDTMNTKEDKYNITLTIKNILKGDKENRMYFLVDGGTQKFIDIILESTDIKMLEICIYGIQEQARAKKFMLEILKNEKMAHQLQQIMKKCLDITEEWPDEVSHQGSPSQTRQQPSGSTKVQEKAPIESQESSLRQSKTQTNESNFKYSIDESNFQIPDFMKNELEKLQNEQGEHASLKIFDNAKETRMGKIRNCTYFIIGRALKFGLSTKFIINNCQLISKLIKDLSLINQNQFLFQNLLLVAENLKREQQAIVDLIGNNYDVILDQIYEIEDKDKKNSLLKVVINLMLEASSDLTHNPMIFQRLFGITKDQRSDSSMIENILWMATSLCEQKVANQNFESIIDIMMQNQIIMIIWKSLSSKEERIILQALKLLTKLSSEGKFRSNLFQHDELFDVIKEISISTSSLKKYEIEIQTALCECLDQITQVHESLNIFNASESGQISQIKIFNKYLINLALQKEYIIERMDEKSKKSSQQTSIVDGVEMAKDESTHQKAKRQQQQQQVKDDQENLQAERGQNVAGQSTSIRGGESFIDKVNKSLSMQDGMFSMHVELDDIERLQNSNQMIENIIFTLSNISNDHNMHQELLSNGIIEVIQSYVKLFVGIARLENAYGINELEQGVNILKVLPTGALKMIKSITEIIFQLSRNPDMIAPCSRLGLIQSMKDVLLLKDYKIMNNIYLSFSEFLTCQDPEIRRKMVHHGVLQLFLEEYETNEFFKIKRICKEILSSLMQLDPQLFDLNEMVQQKVQQEQMMLENGMAGGLPVPEAM